MTRVLFYHGAANRLNSACEWLHYAFSRSQRVLVYAPDPAVAERVDRQLWCADPLSFIPHVRQPSALAGETPIVIVSTLDDLDHDETLLNLSNDVPPGFARFQRLVEFVGSEGAGADSNDVGLARQRFRIYKDMGYQIKTFDLST